MNQWNCSNEYYSPHIILTPPIEVYPPKNLRKKICPHKTLANFQIKSPLIIIGGGGGSRNHSWSRSLTKKKNFSRFLSCYHRLASRKKIFLPLEKYFKTLKDMIIGTADALFFESFTQFFKVGEMVVSKSGHLMLPGAFPEKVTPDIDFKDEAVV